MSKNRQISTIEWIALLFIAQRFPDPIVLVFKKSPFVTHLLAWLSGRAYH